MMLWFLLEFQCCYFPDSSSVSILIRYSFVSYTCISFPSMTDRQTSVCIFETLAFLKAIVKISGVTESKPIQIKGNMMLVSLSICRKLICSTVNI